MELTKALYPPTRQCHVQTQDWKHKLKYNFVDVLNKFLLFVSFYKSTKKLKKQY